MNDTVFQQKLLSVMTDNKYDRIIPKRRSGKLDHKNAWRVHTGAENIFRQKQERKGKEYSVVLLVDESGSMGTIGWGADKMMPTKGVVSFMARQLQKAGINFAIIGFNAKIRTHKPFGSTMHESDLVKLEDDLYAACHGKLPGQSRNDISCNHDYDAIESALRMLAPTKHGKILITFSDGHPNCDYGSGCGYDEQKHQHAKIRAMVRENPQVVTIGVGILESMGLNKIYDQVVDVQDLTAFKDQVIGVLAKNIKRG